MAHDTLLERLWARLADAPSDGEAAQLLADALQSDGDRGRRALGELLALERELQREPRWRRRIVRATTALREAHATELLGPLAGLPALARDVPGVRASIEWGPLGVRTLSLRQDLREGDASDIARLLDEALALPALRLLERLEVNVVLFGGPFDAHRDVVALLARRAPPSLRTLTLQELGDPWGEPLGVEPCALAPLSSLSRLRALCVVGSEVALDKLALPSLHTLRLEGALPAAVLAAIAAARWPALEVLQLGFDAEAAVSPVPPIRALLDGRCAPRLRELTLDTYGTARHGPALVEAIATSPQRPHLAEVALDRVDRATSDALLARREAFAHLTRLGARPDVGPRPLRLKGLCRHVDCGEHRLERAEDDRFVEVEIDEPRVRVREGRIGHPGRLRVLDTGWRGCHREIEARRLDGYRTVRAAYGGRRDEVPNRELWDAIRARPDAPAPYRAYAEWLRAWGLPRAELIELQCARAERPDDARVARREAALLGDDHTAEILLGELRPHVAGVASPSLVLEWRFGFVRAATLTALPGDDDLDAAAEVVALLLDHPSGRLLEELALANLSPDAASRVQAAVRGRGRRARITRG